MILNGFKFDMTGSLERGIPVSYMPSPVFLLCPKQGLAEKIPERSEDDFSSQPVRVALSATRQKASFAWKNQEYLRMDYYRTTVQLGKYKNGNNLWLVTPVIEKYILSEKDIKYRISVWHCRFTTIIAYKYDIIQIFLLSLR